MITIYQIYCEDEDIKDIYIGSTKNYVNRQRNQGSSCNNEICKDFSLPVYKFIRNNGGAKIITFEGTSNTNLFDMTLDTEDGQTLVLQQARFEITYTGNNFPRMVNIQLGNVVSTDHVIDNDVSFNYFKTILDHNPVTVDAVLRNISVTYPQTAFKMSGRLNKMCQVNLYDSTHTPLPGLVYFSMQFLLI